MTLSIDSFEPSQSGIHLRWNAKHTERRLARTIFVTLPVLRAFLHLPSVQLPLIIVTVEDNTIYSTSFLVRHRILRMYTVSTVMAVDDSTTFRLKAITLLILYNGIMYRFGTNNRWNRNSSWFVAILKFHLLTNRFYFSLSVACLLEPLISRFANSSISLNCLFKQVVLILIGCSFVRPTCKWIELIWFVFSSPLYFDFMIRIRLHLKKILRSATPKTDLSIGIIVIRFIDLLFIVVSLHSVINWSTHIKLRLWWNIMFKANERRYRPNLFNTWYFSFCC